MSARRAKYIIWQSKDGWRWHYKAKNGKKMAESGEAYSSRRKCIDALRTFRGNNSWAPVVEFVTVIENEFRGHIEEKTIIAEDAR